MCLPCTWMPCGADAGPQEKAMEWLLRSPGPISHAACFVTDNTRRPTARLRTCPKPSRPTLVPMKIQLLSDPPHRAHPTLCQSAPGADPYWCWRRGSYGRQPGGAMVGTARFRHYPNGVHGPPVLRAGQPRISPEDFDKPPAAAAYTDKLGITGGWNAETTVAEWGALCGHHALERL